MAGDGDPLLLVAGCGQPAVAWHLSLVPALVDGGFTVATFDNRGVAPSSSPPGPYSVEAMADDAMALLDHLGWDGPVLVAGHSMGGWIAEMLALDHPERVRAAALMGSANRPTAWEIAITTVERDLARLDYDLPLLFYATETMRYLPISDLQDSEVVSTWLSLIGELPVGRTQAAWASTKRRSRGRPIPSEQRGGPTCACPASCSPSSTTWTRRRVMRRAAAEAIPGCVYREVAGAGHLGIITHAGEVARHLLEFFAGC